MCKCVLITELRRRTINPHSFIESIEVSDQGSHHLINSLEQRSSQEKIDERDNSQLTICKDLEELKVKSKRGRPRKRSHPFRNPFDFPLRYRKDCS